VASESVRVVCCCACVCVFCSVPAGQRFCSPLTHQQLGGLNRLSSKKATDRRSWLEGIVGPLAAAAHTGGSNGSSSSAAPLPAAALPGLGLDPSAAAAAAAAGQRSPAAGGSSGPVLPTGVEVSGALGMVRGRVLPPPHLAYATPECAYPGSQVGFGVRVDVCCACQPSALNCVHWFGVLVARSGSVEKDAVGSEGGWHKFLSTH
jgi:hypothetical protein